MYSNQWMSDGAVLFGAFEKMVHRIKGGKINGNSGSNLTCNCIFLMLAFSVPVSYSIIVSALVTIVAFLTPGFGVFVSAQKMVSGIDSFSLIAVPFFILAGLLMNSGGIAKRLINLALLVLGKVPGSLALTNIAGNAMFGSISGSGIAAATAIGGVMLPLEKEQKYDEDLRQQSISQRLPLDS